MTKKQALEMLEEMESILAALSNLGHGDELNDIVERAAQAVANYQAKL